MNVDSELLTGAVNEAARLLQGDGAMIYLIDEPSGKLRFAHDAGIRNRAAQRLIRNMTLDIGQGMFGTAVQRREMLVTNDYPNDDRFVHYAPTDEIVELAEMRSMVVAPLIVDGDPIGAMGAYSSRVSAFSEAQTALLRALADHAAAAIGNKRLLERLAASVEAQATLQRIAARITAIRDPGEVLQTAVDAAVRLLGSDGAHLTLRDGDEPILRPRVMAGGMDPEMRDWLATQEFPIGGGINGLAAEAGSAIWTRDYLVDPRIPHSEDDQAVARRMGLRGMAAAPLRAPGGRVFGTLAISHREPRDIAPDDVELLQGLADIGAIAIANARLYEQLQESERRYRHLVDHSPDLVWSVDADGRFTYVGESSERVTGYRPEQLLGQHWAILTEPGTEHIARAGWDAIAAYPDEDQQIRILIPLAAGGTRPAEINMIGIEAEGRFAGAHGSIRDISERERLEADLRRRSAELAANEERANLARELHDSVTQALFSMGLTLRALELLLDRDPEAAQGKLVELRELQKDALAEMRNLIFELRPRGLEADGLAQALRTHAAAVEGRTGLAVTVDVELAERLPLDIEEALYRVAQEALHNVVKHANASSARIVLKQDGRQLRLTVEDDGIGFDEGTTPRGHIGLVGMRQRTEGIGGRFDVVRRPEGGTRVRVRLPLSAATVGQLT